MKEKYVTPTTTSKIIQVKSHFIIGSSYVDDSNTCDCFAHKSNHSKCGGGCHNSGGSGKSGEPAFYEENTWSVER